MMKIVIRLLPQDRWHEFHLPSNASFAEAKVTVLQHWKILPTLPAQHVAASVSQVQVSSNSSITSTPSPTTAGMVSSHAVTQRALSSSSMISAGIAGTSTPAVVNRTIKEKRRASLLSPSEGGTAMYNYYLSPQMDITQYCAGILASYSFRSVCSGGFLPDDEVLSSRCVEHDLLVIRPRSRNACISCTDFPKPFMRLDCSVHFIKATDTNSTSPIQTSTPVPSKFSVTQSFDSAMRFAGGNSDRSFSSIPSGSSNNGLNGESGRIFRPVKVQVAGEKLWIFKHLRERSKETDADCLGMFELPALLSSAVVSPREGKMLKVGFLSGQRMFIKTEDDEDWQDLINCLGPEGTTSGVGAGMQHMQWRQNVYQRAIQANTGLLSRPKAPPVKSPTVLTGLSLKTTAASVVPARPPRNEARNLDRPLVQKSRTAPSLPTTDDSNPNSRKVRHQVSLSHLQSKKVTLEADKEELVNFRQRIQSGLTRLQQFEALLQQSHKALPIYSSGSKLASAPLERNTLRRSRSFSSPPSPSPSSAASFPPSTLRPLSRSEHNLQSAFDTNRLNPLEDVRLSTPWSTAVVSRTLHTKEEDLSSPVSSRNLELLDYKRSVNTLVPSLTSTDISSDDAKSVLADPSLTFGSPSWSHSTKSIRGARIVARDDRRAVVSEQYFRSPKRFFSEEDEGIEER